MKIIRFFIEMLTIYRVPYLALARTFQLIEETRGRNISIEILGNYFWSVIKLTPEDLLPSVYLSINQLAPAYEGMYFYLVNI